MMKKLFILSATVVLLSSCLRDKMRGKYDILVGNYRANTKNWCPEDSINSHELEIEFLNNGKVVFRTPSGSQTYRLKKKDYETESDYKIWYHFTLNNGDKLEVESFPATGFNFNGILLTTHEDLFNCNSGTAQIRSFGRVE
ncbi:MAG: hypothetical protein R2809_09900 [Flavobacteriales bacterium]